MLKARVTSSWSATQHSQYQEMNSKIGHVNPYRTYGKQWRLFFGRLPGMSNSSDAVSELHYLNYFDFLSFDNTLFYFYNYNRFVYEKL